jgi:hypothetical protein
MVFPEMSEISRNAALARYRRMRTVIGFAIRNPPLPPTSPSSNSGAPPMTRLKARSRLSLSLAAGLGVACASIGSQFAIAAQPQPPAQLCVDNVCKAAAPVASSGSALKWHPGHYLWLDGMYLNSATVTKWKSTIDGICGNDNIKGVQIVVWWATLEGSSPGDYSAGFSNMDQLLQKLGSCSVPKRLILQVKERDFGSAYTSTPSVADLSTRVPAYLLTDSAYGGGVVTAEVGKTYSGSLRMISRSWEQPVMDRLIALSQAYAKRYDGNPYFEMITLGETAVPALANFTYSAYTTQFKRWMSASAQAWPHTLQRLNANYSDSDSRMLDLIKYCAGLANCAVGGPDPETPLPEITRSIQANRVFRAATSGGADYRGVIPWVGEQQALGLGASGYSVETPAEIFTYQDGTMQANYMIWLRNDWTGGVLQQWSTGILPFIDSISGKVRTACPSAFGGRCSTD